MKKSAFFFIWITILAVGIMVVITITQLITSKSQIALEEGNKQAVTTFTINNRLEELATLSFTLENRILGINKNANVNVKQNEGIRDSLTQLGYNISVLQNFWSDSSKKTGLHKIGTLIDNQINFSLKILSSLDSSRSIQNKYIDSFANTHFGDSIYTEAIAFQKKLEIALSQNFTNNNKATAQLSALNFTLAVISLLAVLVLVSIIIVRQKKQLQLITALKEARAQALKSGEIKDQFLANMSHEIRTPLNALQGFSNLMLKTTLNKEQEKFGNIISTASNNLLNIVNDILDFSKIESNLLTLKEVPFYIEKELDEIYNMFGTLASEKKLVLQFENNFIENNLLYGDAGRLKQILINIIGNAIKFTSSGVVKLSTSIVAQTESEASFKFVITDTGQGIPTNKLKSIFERFEQVDNSFTRQQGGTGLGLAIVKELTNIMNGSITVESKVGKGSIFTVQLSFEKNKIIDTNLKEKIASVFDIDFLTNKNILVVEDNEMNQLLIDNILIKYNATLFFASNGINALQILNTNKKIDLVLMDVQMPEMDGITATKKIRELHGNTLPIIAMTAHVLENEKQKCLQAGMNDYLTKPINTDALLNTINKWLFNNVAAKMELKEVTANTMLGLQYLNTVCNNDETKVNHILTKLTEKLNEEIVSLQNIILEKDTVALHKIIHSLKSTLSPLDEDTAVNIALANFSTWLATTSNYAELAQKGSELSTELNTCKTTITILTSHKF